MQGEWNSEELFDKWIGAFDKFSNKIDEGAKKAENSMDNASKNVKTSSKKMAKSIQKSADNTAEKISSAFNSAFEKINIIDFKIELDNNRMFDIEKQFSDEIEAASKQIKIDIENFSNKVNGYIKEIFQKKDTLIKYNVKNENHNDLDKWIPKDEDNKPKKQLTRKQRNQVNSILDSLNIKDKNLKKELEKQLENRERLIERYNSKKDKINLSDGTTAENQTRLNNAIDIYKNGAYIKQLEKDIANQLDQKGFKINFGDSIDFDGSILKNEIESFADNLVSKDVLNKLFGDTEEYINQRYQHIFDSIKEQKFDAKINIDLFPDVFKESTSEIDKMSQAIDNANKNLSKTGEISGNLRRKINNLNKNGRLNGEESKASYVMEIANYQANGGKLEDIGLKEGSKALAVYNDLLEKNIKLKESAENLINEKTNLNEAQSSVEALERSMNLVVNAVNEDSDPEFLKVQIEALQTFRAELDKTEEKVKSINLDDTLKSSVLGNIGELRSHFDTNIDTLTEQMNNYVPPVAEPKISDETTNTKNTIDNHQKVIDVISKEIRKYQELVESIKVLNERANDLEDAYSYYGLPGYGDHNQTDEEIKEKFNKFVIDKREGNIASGHYEFDTKGFRQYINDMLKDINSSDELIKARLYSFMNGLDEYWNKLTNTQRTKINTFLQQQEPLYRDYLKNLNKYATEDIDGLIDDKAGKELQTSAKTIHEALQAVVPDGFELNEIANIEKIIDIIRNGGGIQNIVDGKNISVVDTMTGELLSLADAIKQVNSKQSNSSHTPTKDLEAEVNEFILTVSKLENYSQADPQWMVDYTDKIRKNEIELTTALDDYKNKLAEKMRQIAEEQERNEINAREAQLFTNEFGDTSGFDVDTAKKYTDILNLVCSGALKAADGIERFKTVLNSVPENPVKNTLATLNDELFEALKVLKQFSKEFDFTFDDGSVQGHGKDLFSWISENATEAQKDIFEVTEGFSAFQSVLRGLSITASDIFSYSSTLGLDVFDFNVNDIDEVLEQRFGTGSTTSSPPTENAEAQVEELTQEVEELTQAEIEAAQKAKEIGKVFGITNKEALKDIQNVLLEYNKNPSSPLPEDENGLLKVDDFDDEFDMFADAGVDLTDVLNTISKHIKSSNTDLEEYLETWEKVRKHVSSSTIHLEDGMTSEWGDDFKHRRATIGAKNVVTGSGAGTNINTFLSELNEVFGTTFKTGVPEKNAFNELYEYLRDKPVVVNPDTLPDAIRDTVVQVLDGTYGKTNHKFASYKDIPKVPDGVRVKQKSNEIKDYTALVKEQNEEINKLKNKQRTVFQSKAKSKQQKIDDLLKGVDYKNEESVDAKIAELKPQNDAYINKLFEFSNKINKYLYGSISEIEKGSHGRRVTKYDATLPELWKQIKSEYDSGNKELAAKYFDAYQSRGGKQTADKISKEFADNLYEYLYNANQEVIELYNQKIEYIKENSHINSAYQSVNHVKNTYNIDRQRKQRKYEEAEKSYDLIYSTKNETYDKNKSLSQIQLWERANELLSQYMEKEEKWKSLKYELENSDSNDLSGLLKELRQLDKENPETARELIETFAMYKSSGGVENLISDLTNLNTILEKIGKDNKYVDTVQYIIDMCKSGFGTYNIPEVDKLTEVFNSKRSEKNESINTVYSFNEEPSGQLALPIEGVKEASFEMEQAQNELQQEITETNQDIEGQIDLVKYLKRLEEKNKLKAASYNEVPVIKTEQREPEVFHENPLTEPKKRRIRINTPQEFLEKYPNLLGKNQDELHSSTSNAEDVVEDEKKKQQAYEETAEKAEEKAERIKKAEQVVIDSILNNEEKTLDQKIKTLEGKILTGDQAIAGEKNTAEKWSLTLPLYKEALKLLKEQKAEEIRISEEKKKQASEQAKINALNGDYDSDNYVINQTGRVGDDNGWAYTEQFGVAQTQKVMYKYDDDMGDYIETRAPEYTNFKGLTSAFKQSYETLKQMEYQLKKNKEMYGEAYDPTALEHLIARQREYVNQLLAEGRAYGQNTDYVMEYKQFVEDAKDIISSTNYKYKDKQNVDKAKDDRSPAYKAASDSLIKLDELRHKLVNSNLDASDYDDLLNQAGEITKLEQKCNDIKNDNKALTKQEITDLKEEVKLIENEIKGRIEANKIATQLTASSQEDAKLDYMFKLDNFIEKLKEAKFDTEALQKEAQNLKAILASVSDKKGMTNVIARFKTLGYNFDYKKEKHRANTNKYNGLYSVIEDYEKAYAELNKLYAKEDKNGKSNELTAKIEIQKNKVAELKQEAKEAAIEIVHMFQAYQISEQQKNDAIQAVRRTNTGKTDSDLILSGIKQDNKDKEKNTKTKWKDELSKLRDELKKALQDYSNADQGIKDEANVLLEQLKRPNFGKYNDIEFGHVDQSNVDDTIKKIKSATNKIINTLKEQHKKIEKETAYAGQTRDYEKLLNSTFDGTEIDDAKFKVATVDDSSGKATLKYLELVGDKARETIIALNDVGTAIEEIQNGTFDWEAHSTKSKWRKATKDDYISSSTDATDEPSVNQIQKIIDSYNGLIKTEDKYQKLRAKMDSRNASPTQIAEFERLTLLREKYNNTIKQSIVLSEEEQRVYDSTGKKEIQKLEAKYAEKQVDASYTYGAYLNTNRVSDVDSAYDEAVKVNNALKETQQILNNLNVKNISGFDTLFDNTKNDIAELNKDLQSGIIDPKNIEKDYTTKINDIITKLNNTIAVTNPFDLDSAKNAMYEYASSLRGVELGTFNEQTQSLNVKFKDQKGIIKDIVLEYDQVTGAIRRIEKTSNNTKGVVNSFFAGWKKRLTSLAQYLTTFVGFYEIIGAIRSGISVIRELDIALTEMRKVSDESVSSLKNFQNVSFDIASSIGTTAVQIQNSAASFMRLGYSLKEASELAEDANIYANVGDMEIDEATEHMISSIKAWESEFNSEVEASEAIIDRYNEIGLRKAYTCSNT